MANAFALRLRRHYRGLGLACLILLAGGGLSPAQEPPPSAIREGPPPIEKPLYTDLGTFIVNMPGDKYFLKGSIQIVFAESAPKSWLDARLPIVKDMVISHLQSITVEQFDDLKNRNRLRSSLQNRINSLFPNNPAWDDLEPVRRVLFLELYRQ